MRAMSAAHAAAHSVRARCHATTWPPATAMSTTAFLRSQMPSRNTTSCASPVAGAIGQILHAHDVLRQKVDLLVLRSATASFESSHARNASSALAALSILRTPDAPHDRQRHLCVPAFVLPFLLILAPHTLHSRAIVTAANDVVEMDLSRNRDPREATLFADGELLSFDAPVKRVYVSRGAAPTVLLRYQREGFYEHAAKVFF